jgi:predicted NAD/FAD-binding protein
LDPEVIETAIVGSGFSGLSAALFVARAGRLTLY